MTVSKYHLAGAGAALAAVAALAACGPGPATPGAPGTAARPAVTAPAAVPAAPAAPATQVNAADVAFTGAMLDNRTAEIALCRTELSRGASTRARTLARIMLSQRQAELAQLQAWRQQREHAMMPG